MRLQSLFSLLPFSVAPFHSSGSTGKPTKLLQVGRLPALGCIHPLGSPGHILTIKDNTWNAYGCNINETVLLDNAKIMKEAGLLEAGYKYIVIDGTSSANGFNGRLLDDE